MRDLARPDMLERMRQGAAAMMSEWGNPAGSSIDPLDHARAQQKLASMRARAEADRRAARSTFVAVALVAGAGVLAVLSLLSLHLL
jgi:hypothetical protein